MKKSNWVIFLVNGLIAILFGLLMIFIQQATILNLVRIFGLIILLGGLIMFYSSYKNMKAQKSYVLLMIESFVAILIGAIIAISPGKSLNLFLILVGIWATLMGLFQIIISVNMRKKVSNHYLFTINGVITLIFGLLLFYSPMGTAKGIMTIIGILALAAGVLLVYLAFKVKGMVDSR